MNLIIIATTTNQMAIPWVRNMEVENCDLMANSDVTKFVGKCLTFVAVIARYKHACSVL